MSLFETIMMGSHPLFNARVPVNLPHHAYCLTWEMELLRTSKVTETHQLECNDGSPNCS